MIFGKTNLKSTGIATIASVVVLILGSSFFSHVSAQTKDIKAVTDVLNREAAAVEKGDLATLDKLWVNDSSVTVFESGYANYGWDDYRNHHLAPELKEFKNTKYAFSDLRIKTSGSLAFATLKYTISGDDNGKHFEGSGLATAVLEKGEGKWRIVHWHSSAPRRQPAQSPTPKN